MSNLFVRFKRLLGSPVQQVGTVTVVDGTVLHVSQAGGGVARVTGAATVGQKIYFTAGKMDGLAPSLTEVFVEE